MIKEKEERKEYFNNVPLSTPHEYWLNTHLHNYEKFVRLHTKILKSTTKKNLPRNMQVIRFHLYGYGVWKIEKLMYEGGIENRITIKPITVVIQNFLRFIGEEEAEIYNYYREENIKIKRKKKEEWE